MKLTACAVCAVLTACSALPRASNGDDAYWQDQRWDGKLLDAVQSALHYPADASGQPVQPIPQTAQATVGFTYQDGKISTPRIIESSGRADLDAAFLAQVVTADPPKAHGSHAAEPHPFELVLEMPTPMQEFEVGEYTAINAQREYPREAILTGAQGTVIVGFNYLDGRAHDVAIVKSSGDRALDGASIRAVIEARLPARPAWMPEDPLSMRVSLCYSLGNSSLCPRTQAVLQISDTP